MKAYQRFGLFDVLVAEEELAVQVAEVDGVEIDDMDLAKAGQGEVLEQLAADSSSSDHQNAGLFDGQDDVCARSAAQWAPYLFDLAMQRAEALAGVLIATHCKTKLVRAVQACVWEREEEGGARRRVHLRQK